MINSETHSNSRTSATVAPSLYDNNCSTSTLLQSAKMFYCRSCLEKTPHWGGVCLLKHLEMFCKSEDRFSGSSEKPSRHHTRMIAVDAKRAVVEEVTAVVDLFEDTRRRGKHSSCGQAGTSQKFWAPKRLNGVKEELLHFVLSGDPCVPAERTEKESTLRTQSDLESSNSSKEEQTSAKSVMLAPMTLCKEPSGAEYSEMMCSAVPVSSRDGIAEFKKPKLYMAKQYKIATTILTDQDEVVIVTAKLKIGAVSILTLKELIPTTCLTEVQLGRVNAGALGNTTYTVEGDVGFRVEIGEHVTTAFFCRFFDTNIRDDLRNGVYRQRNEIN